MGIRALPEGAQETGRDVQQNLQSCVGTEAQRPQETAPRVPSFQGGPCLSWAWHGTWPCKCTLGTMAGTFPSSLGSQGPVMPLACHGSVV